MNQTTPTEFEVQSLAYTNLRRYFPVVRGEVVIKNQHPGEYKGRKSNIRIDIGIFDSSYTLKLIIEIKKSTRCRHINKTFIYTKITGVPCLPIFGLKQAYDVVKIVKTFIKANNIIIK